MTDHQKAVAYARRVEYAETHIEQTRAAARAWYGRNKLKANCSSWRYDQAHYQERLAYFRERSKRLNDTNRKIPYKPRMSRRVPECAENAAHTRSMMMALSPVRVGLAIALMK